MLCAKIVQAENKAKFIWDLLRRRLCSEKIVQAENKAKFIWDLLRRSLCSEKIVQAENKVEFIGDLLKREKKCGELYSWISVSFINHKRAVSITLLGDDTALLFLGYNL